MEENDSSQKGCVQLYSAALIQHFVEPLFAAITAASLLGIQYIDQLCTLSDKNFGSIFFLQNSVRLDGVCLNRNICLATDYQLHLGMKFDWSVLTHGCALLTPSIFPISSDQLPGP